MIPPEDGPALVLAAGRLLLGGLFVLSGLRHLFIQPVLTDALRERGVPRARLVLLLATAFQISAGAFLALSLHVPSAALCLIAFTVTATILMLNFWDMQGPERQAAVQGWMTNAAIVGGLLLAAGG